MNDKSVSGVVGDDHPRNPFPYRTIDERNPERESDGVVIFKNSAVGVIPYICEPFVLPQPRPPDPTLVLTAGLYPCADSHTHPIHSQETKASPRGGGVFGTSQEAGDSWTESDGAGGDAEVAPPLDAATAVRGSKPLTETKLRAGGCCGQDEGPPGLLGFGGLGSWLFRPHSLITHNFLLGSSKALCDQGSAAGQSLASRAGERGGLGISGHWPRRRLSQRWQCNLRHPLPFHLPAPGAQRT